MRTEDLMCRAIYFSEAPHEFVFPSFEAEVVASMHSGSGSSMPTASYDAPMGVIITLLNQPSINVASGLIWGRCFANSRNFASHCPKVAPSIGRWIAPR